MFSREWNRSHEAVSSSEKNVLIMQKSKEMDFLQIIDKYYPDQKARDILYLHSRQVADKALAIAEQHPELDLDRVFLEEAAMLHDIGIFKTDALAIECHGTYPYLCHGYLGADLLREEGFPKHALVCERHTGAGISLEDIQMSKLPLPHRDMIPVSLEEQVICFADKFFSKTHLGKEKTVEKARKSIARYGGDGLCRFDKWCRIFL